MSLEYEVPGTQRVEERWRLEVQEKPNIRNSFYMFKVDLDVLGLLDVKMSQKGSSKCLEVFTE